MELFFVILILEAKTYFSIFPAIPIPHTKTHVASVPLPLEKYVSNSLLSVAAKIETLS